MEKLERLVKFSISMRKETQQLVDQIANDNNRSRSCMIDMICMEYFDKKKEKEKSATGHKV
jgi:metal-responsive CopG/Arc/MetJ family transcriptional regulator